MKRERGININPDTTVYSIQVIYFSDNKESNYIEQMLRYSQGNVTKKKNNISKTFSKRNGERGKRGRG